ncbi:DUF6864 domain-containing function [Photobacterium rosenbergii]|uniref:DUF1842 domain-containing protein n=1 Tax=Photobacterium rosenbergii TaxID=294936 RepID=A0ABU3ZBL7_9GAMM|nr:hypothetical protein [Photobacterium rosenbergii]MDV5167505.1 hypothetical protein [Photobacterium rosenbergii]
MNNHDIPVSVSTNGLEVIASGLVHLTTPDVSFKVGDLDIRFIFQNDKGEGRYEGKVENGILTINLFNFSSAIGEGNPVPLSIATIKGRELFVTYYVNTFNNGPLREFHYTFMLGGTSE